jgi:hypothetical protein
MLNDEIEKKLVSWKGTKNTRVKWVNPLNYDMSYEIKLIMYKSNHNKLWNLIFNKLNVKVWN